MPRPYPLDWPLSQPRTLAAKRRRSQFQVSFAQARDELLQELERMKAVSIVISSNVALRQDGLPYANIKEPLDPGVAVYFGAFEQTFEQTYAFACDRWDRTKDNLRAIGLHIAAIRDQERWGVGSIEQAFAGYQLPSSLQWWQVLGIQPQASWEEIRAAYRRLSRQYHPDTGADRQQWDRIVSAYEQAQKLVCR